MSSDQSWPSERRSPGRLSQAMLQAFQPLLRQFNVVPLQLCLSCAITQPDSAALSRKLSWIAGLEIVPVASERVEIVKHFVRPLLEQLVAQINEQPGSVWVPDSQTLWTGLSQAQRSQLVKYAVKQIKLKMTPLAQKFRCYPASLSLDVHMPDPSQESILDLLCETTGWDIQLSPEPSHGPESPNRPWQQILSREDFENLQAELERFQVQPSCISLLVAMTDTQNWLARQEMCDLTGLPILPFEAEEAEITAALREKIGTLEQDFWRQVAILPVYFQIDRLLPWLVEHEILPLRLVLRLGMTNPNDLLTLSQIRLLTGFDIEPTEMSKPRLFEIIQRILSSGN